MGWFRNIRGMHRQAKVAVRVSSALEQAARSEGLAGNWDHWAQQFFKSVYAEAPHAFDPSHPLVMNVDMAVFLVLTYPVQAETQHKFPDDIVKIAYIALKNEGTNLLGTASRVREEEKMIVQETLEALENQRRPRSRGEADMWQAVDRAKANPEENKTKTPDSSNFSHTPDYLKNTGWHK